MANGTEGKDIRTVTFADWPRLQERKETSKRNFTSAVHRGGGGAQPAPAQTKLETHPISRQGNPTTTTGHSPCAAPRIPTTRLPKFAAAYIKPAPTTFAIHPPSPSSSLLAQRPCLPSRAPCSPAPPPAHPPPPPPASRPPRPRRSPGPPRRRPRLPLPARARGRAAPAPRRPSRPASRAASSAATAPLVAPRRPRLPSSSAGLPPLVWLVKT